MTACVCPPMYERLQAFDDFLDCWFLALINAYLMRKLTFEQDRDNAVTQVARAVARRFGKDFDARGLMIAVWEKAISKMLGEDNDGFYFDLEFDLPPNRTCNGLGSLKLHGTTVDIVKNTPSKTTFKSKGADGEMKEGEADGLYNILFCLGTTGCKLVDKEQKQSSSDRLLLEGEPVQLALLVTADEKFVATALISQSDRFLKGFSIGPMADGQMEGEFLGMPSTAELRYYEA